MCSNQKGVKQKEEEKSAISRKALTLVKILLRNKKPVEKRCRAVELL